MCGVAERMMCVELLRGLWGGGSRLLMSSIGPVEPCKAVCPSGKFQNIYQGIELLSKKFGISQVAVRNGLNGSAFRKFLSRELQIYEIVTETVLIGSVRLELSSEQFVGFLRLKLKV